MATLSRRRIFSAVRVACGLLLASSAGHAANPPTPRASAKAVKPTRADDSGARHAIAGGRTGGDLAGRAESPELVALREAERELFPRASPAPGSRWPTDLPSPSSLAADGAPRVVATGLPSVGPLPEPSRPPDSEAGLPDLTRLEMPDLPVRWDERVLRYLRFFRDDPHGRTTFAALYRRSGRWRDLVRRVLRSKALPEDLAWVAMIESGFDVAARSPAGAAGLWQFMPETAKIYGLAVDHWLDQRFSASASSEAAADFLGDLHRRFGSWELALAAFNMGYVGVCSVVRRYNTNDFWSLARTEGTLPWETTLYVPKVLAAAVVAHNLAAFGFAELAIDSPFDSEGVETPPGTALAIVAQAANVPSKDVEAFNPELRAARTPPDAPYVVLVPRGHGPAALQGLAKLHREQPQLERYIVRFGETLDQIAAARRTTTQKLVDLNAISPGESVRGGTVLWVPRFGASLSDAAAPAVPSPSPPGPKQSVVVPADLFVYPDRKRVFYRVMIGDTLKEIASALQVTAEDLRRWNDLDPGARLQEGMTVQAFVARKTDLSRVVVVPESDVTVLPVGSDEFFAALEHERGFRRVTVAAKAGETIEAVGKRFDVSARTMERINRRARTDILKSGDTVVVYVPGSAADRLLARAPSSRPVASVPLPADAAPLGPLPAPPVPDLLP